MKNLFAALALALISNAASADAFAPWETRMPAVDRNDAPSAEVMPAGFAPWRDRAVGADMPDGVQLGAMPWSVFRPWA
ncbi:MAG: hypothetical protein RLW61_08635 [Gammaproteobacteria bacterium]